MKEKIEIRPMKVEDAEPIVDVLEKTWRSTYSHILTDKILKKKNVQNELKIGKQRLTQRTRLCLLQRLMKKLWVWLTVILNQTMKNI